MRGVVWAGIGGVPASVLLRGEVPSEAERGNTMAERVLAGRGARPRRGEPSVDGKTKPGGGSWRLAREWGSDTGRTKTANTAIRR